MLISLGLSPVSSYSASAGIVVHFRYAEWMVCFPLMAFAVADFLRPKFLFIGIGLQFLTVLLGYIADVLILQWAKVLIFGIAFLLYVFLNITIYLVCIAVSNYQNMINGSKSECTHYFELSQGSIKTLGFGIGIMLSVVVGWFAFAQLGVIPQEIHFLVSPFVDVSAHCYFIGLLFHLSSQSDEMKKSKMVAELKEQSIFQSKFLRFVYHEIRNPFNSIMLGLDHLLSEVQFPDHIEILLTLKKSAQSLHRVINDAVELSKSQGALELVTEPINIEQLVHEAVNDFQPLARSKQVVIQMLVSKHIPPYVLADQAKLKKIFQTLVSNGVKFSPPGSHLAVTFEIEEYLPSNRVCYHFQVSDHGPGITNDLLPLIFEPFGLVRPGDFSEDEQRGSGLSLCIAQHLADLMDTKITVKTELGKGSIFNFFLALETWHVNERSWSKELIQSLSESLATTPKRLFSPRRRYQKNAANKVIPTKERQRKKHSNDSDRAAAIRPLRNRSLELPLSSPPSLSSKDCNEFPSQDSNPSGSGRVNKSRSRPVNWNRIFESSKSNDDTLPCVSTSLDRTGSFFFGRKSLRLSLHRSTRMSPKNGELQVWGEAGSDSKPSSRGSFNSSLVEDSCSQGQSKSSLEIKRTRGKSLTASQHSKNSNSLGCLKSSFLSSSKSSHLAMSTSKNNHSVDSMERSLTGVRTDVMPLSILRSGHSFSERTPKSLRISTHYAEPKDDTHPLQGFKEATSVVSSPAMKNIGMEHETPLASPLMRTNHQELEPLQTLHSKAEKGFNTTAGLVLSARPSPSKKKRELDNRRHSLQSPAYCFQEQEPVQNMLARKDHQPASAILLPCKKKNILIVDDVNSNVKLAEMILRKAGYCCDLAYNGLEAVNASHLKHYDLILMDNVMPIMNGIEATKKILLLKPDALIVGLTGNILPLDQEEFLRAGAKLILPKPIERIQLLETCNRFCSK